MCDIAVGFDLDDTLYKEIDFVRSAFGEVAEKAGYSQIVGQMMSWYYEGKNVFEELIATVETDITVAECIKIYRNHYPKISLESHVKNLLDELKDRGAIVGLITDGRRTSQQNKIKALGLEGYFDIEVISEEFGSEKPDERNYRVMMDMFPERKRFIYVGDNTEKDFLAPNRLGWTTVCLTDDGRNIHHQHFDVPEEYMPQKKIDVLSELTSIVI